MNQIKNYFLLIALGFFSTVSFAQTADEIVDGYFEATGGRDAWSKVDNLQIDAKVNQGGMEIPLEIVQCRDGKSYTKVSFQGLSILQNVYDGETLWNTNFQTMKAEKATTEDLENHKMTIGDFPDPLLNYKEKGYKLEMVGKEAFDGTESHKLKLTKTPMLVEGKEVDNVEFYYFDTETMILLGSESEIKAGPMQGKVQQSKFSEYQEVEGLYFPFSMTQGMKDGESQAIVIDKVAFNVEMDAEAIQFPAATAAPVEEPANSPTTPPTAAPTKKTTTAPTTQPSGSGNY